MNQWVCAKMGVSAWSPPLTFVRLLLEVRVGASPRAAAARHRPGVHGQSTERAMGGARSRHYRPSLALRWVAFYQGRLRLRFRPRDGHLSGRPDRADAPWPHRPVSSWGL